jgi:hypothetical protein
VKIVKNERDPPLFTGRLLIKFQKILRNTTQVIVQHRICLQTDGHGETSIPPYNFVAGGIINSTETLLEPTFVLEIDRCLIYTGQIVKPVHNGHSREPENVAFMHSCP